MKHPYRSSSAAFRAVRHYEAKHGKSNFCVEKISHKSFLITPSINDFNYKSFVENYPKTIKSGETEFKFFPDGVNGQGYYELKTGNRRRPNSIFMDCLTVYVGIKHNTITL